MKKFFGFIANIIILTAFTLTVMAITDRAQNAGWLKESPITAACGYVVECVGEKFDENYVEETYRWIHLQGEKADISSVELN